MFLVLPFIIINANVNDDNADEDDIDRVYLQQYNVRMCKWTHPVVVNCDVQQTVEAWRAVFYIAGAVYAFGTIFYGLLGSGKLQPWAGPSQDTAEVELKAIPADEKDKSEA